MADISQGKRRITVLVESLDYLLANAQPDQRLPALETILARGDKGSSECSSPDKLRFAQFGVQTTGSLPVAAITEVADRGSKPEAAHYWLRADPVTLWADMARVIMTSYGFADLDENERNEIENTVGSVLSQEGMDFKPAHPERWTIALEQALEFNFTPLDEALGMDVADALPDHPEALHWRRILNEIQMSLHACPVNIKRRSEGRQEINSVWFWGGGYLPSPGRTQSDKTVYSNHPVTRGLALVHDCVLKDLCHPKEMDFSTDKKEIVIDWTAPRMGAPIELEQLERLAQTMLDSVRKQGATLRVHSGSGKEWFFRRSCRQRFWKRRLALSSYKIT
jgi:hypothetical protein